MPTLFLTGYERETIAEFLDKLIKNNVDVVIDVRELPLSRKFGFSKNILKDKLAKKNIKYYHFSELGSPSIIRHDLREGRSDYLDFFKKYRSHLIKQKEFSKKTIEVINSHKISTLLCFEKETDLCHRTILAGELLKMNRNMRVIPL